MRSSAPTPTAAPAPRPISAAEAALLEQALPPALTDDMREIALALYAALVTADPRAGAKVVSAEACPDWLTQLNAWIAQVLAQLFFLAEEIGGRSIYFAKCIGTQAAGRHRQLYDRYQAGGVDYDDLGRIFGYTEVRVRQIIKYIELERFEKKQGKLF